MYYKRIARALAGGMALAGVCLTLFCTYERNNPIDPGAGNYVGDESANDHTPPQMVVSVPPADTSIIDFDSVVVAGAVMDMGAGVDYIDVNGIIAIQDSTVAVGNATRVFWHATVYLLQDTSTLTIRAVDRSVHENDTMATKVVVRIRHPRAPSSVGAQMVGDDVRVSWNDESLNETGFVIERKTGTEAFAQVGTADANSTTFIDSVGPFQNRTMYSYRVIAVNAAGQSQPSAAASVNYDLTATDTEGPVIAFVDPTDGVTIPATAVDVYLTVTDPSGVRAGSVKVNDIVASAAGGQWHCTVPLTPGGQNRLTAEALDNSTNANAASVTITVMCDTTAADETGPNIMPHQPEQGETVSAQSIDVIVGVSDVSGIAWVRLDGLDMVKGAGTEYSRSAVSLIEGQNTLVVVAQDNAGNLDTLELEITYDPNLTDTVPPTLTIEWPQNNARFKQTVITVTGTAVDNSGIQQVMVGDSVAAIAYPSWDAQYELVHGHNTIRVTATDKAGNSVDDSVTVLHNQLPRFTTKGDTTIAVGDLYSTIVTAHEPDGDQMTFYKVGIPPGASWHQETAGIVVEAFQPNNAGAFEFVYGVSDGWDADTIMWTVYAVNPDTAPVFNAHTVPGYDTVRVGQDYTVQLTATDGNGDPLTFFLEQGPPSMTVGSEGLVQMTPAVQAGSYLVKVGVTDGKDTAYATWDLAIEDNRPPTIDDTSNPPDESATVGQMYVYSTDIHDPDGDPVELMWPDLEMPSGMTASTAFDSLSTVTRLSVEWEPGAKDTGRSMVQLYVHDGYGGCDTLKWYITVAPQGAGPSWKAFDDIPMQSQVPITALAFTPDGRLLAGTAGESLFFHDGVDWHNVGANSTLPEYISSITIRKADGEIFVSGQTNGGYSCVWSCDGAKLTQAWLQYQSLGSTKAMEMVSAGNYAYALMNGDSVGVFRIRQGTSQWARVEQGLPSNPPTALAVDDTKDDVYLGVKLDVYKLPNTMHTWEWRKDFSGPPMHIAKQKDDGDMFVAVNQGPLLRLTANYEIYQTGLPGSNVTELFVSNVNQKAALVAYGDGSTHVSSDGGVTWTLTAGHPGVGSGCMTENAAGRIFAGFENGSVMYIDVP